VSSSSATAPAARTAPPIDHPGIRPGEAYTYRFSVGPIEGARARMSVGLPVVKDGRPLVAVQGEAETLSLVRLVAPVSAAYVLTLDAGTLLPREVTSTEKGMRDRRFHTVLDGRALDLEVTSPQKSHRSRRVLSREARDPLSAYFALRAHTLKPGGTIGLDVLDGAALWRLKLRVSEREDIRLDENGLNPRPPVRAIRLDGTLQRIDDQARPMAKPAPRQITLWLSDDTTRVLLRAAFDSELGRALLELTSYVPPKRRDRALPAPLPGLD